MKHLATIQYREWLMPLVTVMVFCAVLYFLYHELHNIDFRRVLTQAQDTSLAKISFSILLMILAYWTLTLYEVLAVRYVGASVPYPRVAFTALLAYAVGHNVGFASLSGGAMRYRMYSLVGLSATQVAMIILFGGVTFGLGMGLLTGVALLIEPTSLWGTVSDSPLMAKSLGIILLMLTALYYLWALWFKQPLQIKHVIVNAPVKPIVIGQFFVSALDLILSAAVLYVLLPTGHSITFIQFLPVFLVAIALGTLSSIPGGIGVFETVLLLALPGVPTESLLSTILVYRVIYYLIPLLFALTGFVWHEINIHRQKLSGVVDNRSDWLSALAPPLAGSIVFLAGCVLLFSGETPAIDARILVSIKHLEEMKYFIPKATLHIIPDGKHDVHLTYSALVNALITEHSKNLASDYK